MTRLRGVLGGLLAMGVAMLAIAGPADASSRNTLKGKTNQGLRIKVAAREGSIQIIRFTARLACRDGTTLALEESGFLRTPLDRKGRFKDRQFGSTDTVYIRGKMTGRSSIKGRVRVTDKYGGVRCSSKWLSFTVS